MPTSVAYSETRTLDGRALNGLRVGESRTSHMEPRSKNEDVFLNIARTDSGRHDSVGRSDFRRSRLGYSSQGLRSPTTRMADQQTPSPDQRPTHADSPLLAQNSSPTTPYSPASAHPLDDPGRFRYSSLGSGARSTIGMPRSRFSRTSPDTSPRSPSINGERRSSLHDPRLHRHSALSTVRSSRQPSSEVTERARVDTEKARADGTESTLSTTAPSTVWDELEDLKSRIRKLELTGKLPPSSQAAISGTNERPRTATTTMTTLSSSPKHHRKVSTPSADAENPTVQNQVHPLLQSALAKAKSVLSSDVFAALEVTITDALALSTMLGANTAPSGTVSVVNGGYSSERHARRKADSVCRSLTELCLALTDEQLKRKTSGSRDAGTAQPNGTENDSLAPTPSYQRGASHEPEGVERRQSTNRIPSRLEARRASLANPSSSSTEPKTPQSPSIPAPSSRLQRISTSIRSRRIPVDDEPPETGTPHRRSLSRAITEVSTPDPTPGVSLQPRFSHRHSASRSISGVQQDQGLGISPCSPQYQVSQSSVQPQPQPRTPTALSSSIPFRRSYMAPATYTPATSRSNIQAGSRRYGLSPNFSPAAQSSGPEDSPRSPQPEPTQTRISAPSGKMAASYTHIQQPRLRTNSLGARRFGLRPRAPATPDDTVNLDDSID
ncbi:hypothetical protein NUU61_005088 [Penicillium alfredii]|uniref:LPXTG-motif cell wall anchor domain protein n=1 Tax=Penicillium alfredii TaxID=1506179 RepID=A0A9W9K884_9EURO|nr:uncharacterized protein NUU61_005088 [Penicillium alfredii]KAJ5095732.1 hypothetical protein NUU61_005088 [Penicillium alfredii]